MKSLLPAALLIAGLSALAQDTKPQLIGIANLTFDGLGDHLTITIYRNSYISTLEADHKTVTLLKGQELFSAWYESPADAGQNTPLVSPDGALHRREDTEFQYIESDQPDPDEIIASNVFWD